MLLGEVDWIATLGRQRWGWGWGWGWAARFVPTLGHCVASPCVRTSCRGCWKGPARPPSALDVGCVRGQCCYGSAYGPWLMEWATGGSRVCRCPYSSGPVSA